MTGTLDPINDAYYQNLFKQRDNESEPIKIGETVFPTAIAPQELLKEIPLTQYADLLPKQEKYREKAKSCAIWIKKTHGGGGTSILRSRYLRKVTGNPQATVGAKGTDLYVNTGAGRMACLAEIQLLQTLRELEKKEFGEVIFQDLVGIDSSKALINLWNRDCLLRAGTKYKDLNSEFKTFKWIKPVEQALLPTSDEKGRLTTERRAPGGHGFFAFELLLSAATTGQIPETSHGPLISVIGNGEDLGSTPDSTVFGWVASQKIPIAMMTTEKTEIDKKGGQISIATSQGKKPHVVLVEQAQAASAGQLEIFEKIGIEEKRGDQPALFNTNVAVFNLEVLVPKLKKLVGKIGIDAFKMAITPTLIKNKKKSTDSKGLLSPYFQFEGAMGSALLNLDRAWRESFGEPLVHFLNIERISRTRFFSPVKSAFDFFMLFHSDRFSFHTSKFRLVDNRPGYLPQVSLNHDFYLDVENVLETFSGCEVKALDSLTIEGEPVFLRNSKLSGNVHIRNLSGQIVDLSGRSIMNEVVTVESDQEVRTRSL